MTLRLLLAVALLSGGAARTAAAQATDQPQIPVVVTTGEGLVEVVPDRAFVVVTAESRARAPREAQSQAAAAMSAVQKRLLDSGVAAEAIRTLSYSLQQEFDYTDGKQIPRGFVARNTVEVRLDDIDRVGATIDLAVSSGAAAIGGIRFDVKDRELLERDAVRRAVADARARADAAAEGAGRSIDRVLKIEESRASDVPPPMPMMRAAMAESAAGEPPISAGQIEIRARVTLTAALR